MGTPLHVAEAFLPLWQVGVHEHFALFGGRGGGKSHGIAEPVVAHMCQREERVVCGRQYQNSIKDSVKELLEQKIKKMNMAVFFRSTDSELINVSTGSRASFIGMDRNPDSAKSLEGATIFWGEEAQTFTRRATEIIIPTIRAARSRMIWSWNPRFRTDEVDAMFRGAALPEKSYIRAVSWRDNPFFYQTRMPSEYRRSMRANPKRHIHIWEGGYDENPDAAIFTDWSIGRIAIPEKAIPLFGMDFGFSSDPNFLVKAYVIEEARTIFISQEASGHHVPNRNLPALMDTVTESRVYPIVGDSSRPETIEYLQSKGFNIYGARKGAGSIKNGINFLQGYHLMIAPECISMAEEVRDYKWHLDPNGKPLPMPAPYQQDHGIDGLRYAVEDLSSNDPDEDGDDIVYL